MHARAALLTTAALVALVTVTGCSGSASTATPSAAATSRPAEAATPQAASPVPEPSGTATPGPLPSVPDDWQTLAVGDGRTSWSLPPGWRADIEREVVEDRAEWTDYRGLVRDASGTPMLRFEAIASGGQYATDSLPCERPETELFEAVPLGDRMADADAALVSLAYRDGSAVTLAAGISELDPATACEPGILALHPDEEGAGYDYLLFQIVDDAGESYPRFAGFDEARAYLESDQYRSIRQVLASFRSL